MTATPRWNPRPWHESAWRTAMWTAATGLVAMPLVAMQFTTSVVWTGSDFVFAAAMLAVVCGAVEMAMRSGAHWAYRAGVVLSVGTAVALVWINLAVGVLGSEGDMVNLLYAGVLVIGLACAAFARLKASGMAWTLAAVVIAQCLVPVVVLAMREMPAMSTAEVVGVTAFFAVPWLVAAALFGYAARAARLGSPGGADAPEG